MTWSKKLNSRAYDPIAVVSLTSLGGGSVANVVNTEAYYTVVNDYICMFNLYITYDQITAATNIYSVNSPLAINTVANAAIGNGTIFDVASGLSKDVFVQRNGSNNSFAVVVNSGTTIGVAAGSQLRIVGQFAVR